MVNKNHPLPLASYCFDKLAKAKVFIKIDMLLGYFEVYIEKFVEAKINIVMRYGSFVFVEIPFGLCNSLGTFSSLMNEFMCPFTYKFVMVYFDDIIVFSKDTNKDNKNLEHFFEALMWN